MTKWISVNERMPERWQDVIACNEYFRANRIWAARCLEEDNGHKFFVRTDHCSDVNAPLAVTHWLETPKSPYWLTPSGKKEEEMQEAYYKMEEAKKRMRNGEKE